VLEELCVAGTLEELWAVCVVELLEFTAGVTLLEDSVMALLVPLLALLVPLAALLVGVFSELLDIAEMPEFAALLVALLISLLALLVGSIIEPVSEPWLSLEEISSVAL